MSNTAAFEQDLERLQGVRVTRDDAAAVLAELGRALTGEPLVLDGNNAVDLVVDGEVELSLIWLERLPGIVAAMPLPAELTAAPAARVRLLRANLSWAMTQGGSFGRVPGRDEPMLFRLLPLLERNAGRLERELARFVELGLAWCESLENDGDPGAAPPAAMPMGGIRA